MVSLGEEEEPRHEHKEGLFVSALAIFLTSDYSHCTGEEGESVGGEEVGRKLEPGCLASRSPHPSPCIGAPQTPEAEK